MHQPFTLDEPKTLAILDAIAAWEKTESTPEQDALLDNLTEYGTSGFGIEGFDPEADELEVVESVGNEILSILWEGRLLTGPADSAPTLVIDHEDAYYQWQAHLGRAGSGSVTLSSTWSSWKHLLDRDDEAGTAATGARAALHLVKDAVSDLNSALVELDAYIAAVTAQAKGA